MRGPAESGSVLRKTPGFGPADATSRHSVPVGTMQAPDCGRGWHSVPFGTVQPWSKTPVGTLCWRAGLTGWVGPRRLVADDACMSLERLTRRARWMPVDAVFSGRTAAWLHGLDVPACDPIEVTLPKSSQTSHLARVRLTRSDYLASEVSDVRGLPATSLVRTMADLCRRKPVVDGVVLLDMALRAGLLALEELCAWQNDHPRHRGIARLVCAMQMADAGSESPMETRLRVLLMAEGLPRPDVQRSLHDPNGSFLARPDLCYLDARLLIEYDGASSHRDRLADDNRRQNRLVDAGYRVLRFTAGDILHRPATVVGQVRRALAYSSSGSPN